jgi:hypothetical protein
LLVLGITPPNVNRRGSVPAWPGVVEEGAMRTSFLGLVLILLTTGSRALAQDAASPGLPPVPKPLSADLQQKDSTTKPAIAPSASATACSTDANPCASTQEVSPLHDDHQGPWEAIWLRGSYLMYWIKQGPASPALVTTGPTDGNGSQNDPRTKVLFGNSDFDFGRFNGMQYEAGAWLGDQHIWGVNAQGFLLEQRALGSSFSSDANGNPLLALPFNNITTIVNQLPAGAPGGYLVTFPGAFAGNVNIQTTTRLWGAEANVMRNLVACPGFSLDLTAGFRYLDLDERLTVASQSQQLAGGALLFDPLRNGDPNNPQTLPDGSIINITDQFHTRNQFYGGQAGFQAEFTRGCFVLSVATQVAMGPNHQTVDISGLSTAKTPDGTTQALSSGLFALTGTNAARTVTNWFAISPEVTVRCGYRFSDMIYGFVGYNFLYLNNVVRPGSEINANVNTAFVPTTLNFRSFPAANLQPLFQPSLLTKRDDFWAQGIQFGVEFRY